MILRHYDLLILIPGDLFHAAIRLDKTRPKSVYVWALRSVMNGFAYSKSFHVDVNNFESVIYVYLGLISSSGGRCYKCDRNVV